MPVGIKGSVTTPSGSLRKGSVAIGIGDVSPTSTTGFYSMPDPVSGKYIVSVANTIGASNPVFYSPQDITELTNLARMRGATGANTGSEAAILAFFAANSATLVANFQYESIVTDGLVLNLDAGFVGSYPTTGATWYDLSGNSRNGTLANGISFNSANSGSLVLDGADDEITFTGINFGALSAFTICGFVKPTMGNDPSGTIANNSTSGAPFGWHCRFNLERGVGFWIGTDGGLTHYDGIALTNNQWNFFAVTVNSTTITHYKNGVANNTYNGTFNTFVTNNAPFRMGRWEGGSYYYNGNIGNFCYYNRALTAAEVLQNYNAQKGRFGL